MIDDLDCLAERGMPSEEARFHEDLVFDWIGLVPPCKEEDVADESHEKKSEKDDDAQSEILVSDLHKQWYWFLKTI